MTLPIHIKDGEGTALKAGVTADHALKVTSIPLSASDLGVSALTRFKVLRKFLTDSGDSKDLNIDSSGAKVHFKYRPDVDQVAYVTGIRIIIEGTETEIDTNDAKRFGLCTAGSTPLTNGVECFVLQGGGQTDIFAEVVGVLGDFLAWSDDFISLRNIVTSQSDYNQFDIKFDTPVVLTGSLSDEIVVTVNDDLTELDRFIVLSRGYFENLGVE